MDKRTGLGKPDEAELDAFWQRSVQAIGLDGVPRPGAWPFGDSVELADELIELVLDGRKRATAGAVVEFETDGEPLPRIGQLEILLDGAMQPRAVIETTDVRVGPLHSVDSSFAWDEGEGDRSRVYWLEAHTMFFSRLLPALGQQFSDEMATVFQRFEVVYQE